MDTCIAAAGILQGYDCLEYPAEEFQKVMSVNVNGVLFAAQAAGRQMVRFGWPGSIILIASMSGSITNKVSNENSSKVAGSGSKIISDFVSGPCLGSVQYEQIRRYPGACV